MKEQQELAITRSKMLNTGDLQSRIGDEEDKKVIGMIAAKYFGDLPSVDMNNPIEVQRRLDFFFDACIEARISPVVEWIALVLGIEWVSLKQIMAGKRRDDSLQQKYILKLILQMQSMWAYNGMYGQENPAEWIFRAKNYFGMRDNVEVTVAPPEQPLGDAQSAEQLAQKYQTALPKGIDVEYREVKRNERISFTEDGKLVCELTKISFEPYKDKRIIKVRCTVCGRIKRIQNGNSICGRFVKIQMA